MRESFGADAVRRPVRRRGRTRISGGVKKSLQLALREALWLGSRSIGTEHLLLGLLRCDDADVRRLLDGLGVSPEALRSGVLRSLGRAA
jgi:ATP-dependent Clp protease ATP-binding subunit ClpA